MQTSLKLHLNPCSTIRHLLAARQLRQCVTPSVHLLYKQMSHLFGDCLPPSVKKNNAALETTQPSIICKETFHDSSDR